MPYAGAPLVLNGVTLPNPSELDEDPEQVGSDVTLANGSLRRYDLGERLVVSLKWARLDEARLATVRAAATRFAVPYVHEDGATYVVMTDRPKVTPIPGTDPVRFAVELELREQTPRR